LPTTEEEVERAELGGAEFEGSCPPHSAKRRSGSRPSRIKQRRPRAALRPGFGAPAVVGQFGRRPAPLTWPSARASLVTHTLAAALGAAAAAALFLTRAPRPNPAGTLPSREPVPPTASAPSQKIVIGPVRRCAPCCGGADCAGAPADLKQCSSGRSCIPCASDALLDSRYRVRVGALAPTAPGKALIRLGGPLGPRALRARGASAFACGPAHAASDGDQQWTVLPLTPSAQDALAGVELELRARGTRQALGRWQSQVPINATVLCKGLFVKPKTEAGEALGVVSLFLDDAHFVELMRSSDVEALVEHRRRFELADVTPKIFETTSAGDRHFALVLGPVDKPTAERLRWALLDRGQPASIVEGAITRESRGRSTDFHCFGKKLPLAKKAAC
jgi:hypothetical protein